MTKRSKMANRAVVEDHAPEEVEEDTPERKRWRQLNWYATAPWASRAGAEIVKEVFPAAKRVLEPACGDGIMFEAVLPYFSQAWAADIEPQGHIGERRDFLLQGTAAQHIDIVMSNPPFKHAEAFVRKGLEIANMGVAMLCRTAFLEGGERYDLHKHLRVVAPFCERVAINLGPWHPDNSTMTSYSWFIFSRERTPAIVRFIAPGTRDRLTRADDARRFCKAVEMPLLDR